MRLTEEGLALIRRFEGFRPQAYRCPAGIWTIGYGHTGGAGPPDVTPGMLIAEAEARNILDADAQRFAAGVRAALRRELDDRQFSALVSFAYNVGITAFRGSSVLEAVNEGRFADVPGRLRLWVKAKGHVLPGLAARREAEAAMFASAGAPPPAATTAGPALPRKAGLLELIIALFRAIARREKR